MRLTRHALCAAALALAQLAGARAQAPVNNPETDNPPTAARLAALEAVAAGPDGWPALVPALRAASLDAYAKRRYVAADAWFHVYRWAALFSESEERFSGAWIANVRANHLNYAGMEGDYPHGTKLLGSYLSPEMQAWVLSHEDFSGQFFADVTDVDYLPRVLTILEGLHRRDPARFERYASLCLAIAVVYDVAPPPYWPHSQVTAASLPRKLPNPAVPFDYLTAQDMRGRTYLRLAPMRASELKFVVDGSTPVADLDWSIEHVTYPLDQFEQVYFMVSYRRDRADNPALMTWSGPPYTLPEILALGGICCDQAYFASEAGKARGVPTLLFKGQGQDGRHAWFGFLDAQGHWQLDAGRYAEQRLVTGYALDPQTWAPISDHELRFLAERFRALPQFMQSRVHEEFALDFLNQGDAAAAARAARLSVDFERRNITSWELLIAANARTGMDASHQEAAMREAELALAKYPDLVLEYGNRVCESLRARGETSLAAYEERSIADHMRGDRDDLAVRQAANILERSLHADPVERQVATFNALLAQFGHGAGAGFYDGIVVGFVEHLVQLKMRAQARDALERAREALGIQPGTQLGAELDRKMATLQD